MTLRLAPFCAAVLIVLGSSSTASAAVTVPDPVAPRLSLASTAALIDDAPVYAKPGAVKAKATRTLEAGAWFSGNRAVLLVLGSKRDQTGRLWLKVRLPSRPNRSSGWILASHAQLGLTKIRVEVSLNARALRLRSAGKVIFRTRVVVGKRSTPTPRGDFAVSERADSLRGAMIGPFALALTAFSEVLFNYQGGRGQVAIHGRSGALLNDPLGSAASHGCIRLSNNALRLVARFAKAGTPVSIARGWPAAPRGS